MSCPVFWPTERSFDPIGNTSAVSLTRDLPPEVDADILLLNCNDCRNVLFTVFCEHANSRAVILLTMVMDGTPNDIVWNFFYHTSLDEASFATLMTHCRKLAALTESLGDWDGSVYSTVVKFGSTLTLSEVHRLLSLYADSDRVTAPKPADHPAESGTDSAESVEDAASKIIDYYSHSSARSAGPMHKSAERVFQEHYKLYSETGTTFTDERDQASASHHNPTFHYSRHGSDSVVHPCTEPLAPFHTAPVFGDNDSDRVSVADVVDAARREFSLWCRTFRIAAAKTEHLLVVRFLFGDPLAVAHTFEYFNRWKMLTSPMFVAPWSAKVLELSAAEYERDQAPGTFNVIDTSTLWPKPSACTTFSPRHSYPVNVAAIVQRALHRVFRPMVRQPQDRPCRIPL
ncbi:hypothetical protein C8T65DRAFT_802415 [Cerioporus squamosus]|nr:hypothetical protein C8T65DRAFT_802415 [Cerioporus squamosus]